MRVILTVIVPLLLPTVLYVLWASSVGRAELAGTAPWRSLPWAWLVVAGVALAIVVLFTAVETGGRRDGRYVPPRLVNGRIVPGHFVAPAPPQ
jgi:Family of unknown function (DUF6111)